MIRNFVQIHGHSRTFTDIPIVNRISFVPRKPQDVKFESLTPFLCEDFFYRINSTDSKYHKINSVL